MKCMALPLPISEMARSTARSFAEQQPTDEKAEKVLLNTLSVLTVSYYLDLMGISTDVLLNDCWNPVMQLCMDIGDLEVPGIGKIECRPLSASEDFCYIPAETWGTRVAYVVVMFDEFLLEAKVMGFVKSVESEEVLLTQLLPLEDLAAHLEQQRVLNLTLDSTLSSTLVSLSRWFTGAVEQGWQTIESLIDNCQFRPAYVFRSSGAIVTNSEGEAVTTRRAKLFDLGIQIANQPVILMVDITPQTGMQTNIRLQLHPTGDKVYLKSGIALVVLDQSGNVFLEAQSRSADNYIQLQFSGEAGERFSVRVGLDDAFITEHFVI